MPFDLDSQDDLAAVVERQVTDHVAQAVADLNRFAPVVAAAAEYVSIRETYTGANVSTSLAYARLRDAVQTLARETAAKPGNGKGAG